MHTYKTIYIVDRDRKSRDLVSAFLSYQGYDIVTSDDSASLLDDIQRLRVGIVIAEISHFNAIAPDFRERAKEINPLLALVVYGANEELPPRQSGIENLFFLSKPLNLDELESIVMRAGEYQVMKQLGGEAHADRPPSVLCSSIMMLPQNLFTQLEA